jgi:hypothetical protein
LAGHREAINEGRISSLFWPSGKDACCPVEVGEVYPLKTGGVEITRKERVRSNGTTGWRADFILIRPAAKPEYLKRGGGLTTELKAAMPAQDDVHSAATLDPISEEAEEEAHRAAGAPPEGQIVPHHEVLEFRPSREAQQRYLRETAEQGIEETRLPLSERIRRLEESDVDLGRQLARIQEGVVAAEAKRRRLECKVPSDRAA